MTELERPEGEPSSELFPETQALIERLRENPTTPFECSHGGEPAVGIYEVPRGCVALPGVETQCLCPQHVITNGSFEGMTLIVDLSIDAEWSKHERDTPMYWFHRDKKTGEIALLETAVHPLPE